MKLIKHPNPILYQQAQPVDDFLAATKIVEEMFSVMYANNAISLSAPQVGLPLEIIVLHVKTLKFACINPRIVRKWAGLKRSAEMCRSCPGIQATRERYSCIQLEGYNAIGEPIKQKLQGHASFAAQHEIDHLNGVTIRGNANT